MNATNFGDSAFFIFEGNHPRILHVKLSALFSSCVRVIDMIGKPLAVGNRAA